MYSGPPPEAVGLTEVTEHLRRLTGCSLASGKCGDPDNAYQYINSLCPERYCWYIRVRRLMERILNEFGDGQHEYTAPTD